MYPHDKYMPSGRGIRRQNQRKVLIWWAYPVFFLWTEECQVTPQLKMVSASSQYGSSAN